MMVLRDGAGRIYPADRCTWVNRSVGGTGGITDSGARTDGYYVADARFFDGTTANGRQLSGGSNADLSIATQVGGVIVIGQIGKSGRFVALANQPQ